VEALAGLWFGITTHQVFRVGTASLASQVMRVSLQLASGGSLSTPAARSLVDTAPLRALLERFLGTRDGLDAGIDANLRRGVLKAVAITASSYSTGQSITWVQGRDIPQWDRAHRKSVATRLTLAHVMASTALPIFFPAVEVAGQWYGDGGIRLTSPLSPAVHLGADRIIAISTRYARSRVEADQPVVTGYPPPAQVLGVLLNAIFLDMFDADALAMKRVNRLIADVPPEQRRGLRPVRLLLLRPSRDLGQLANDYELHLPQPFRFMTRGLGTRETRSNDLLSMLMFQPDYLKRLIDLGERDAEARWPEVAAFMDGGGPGRIAPR
jgi:NTE family protein